MYTIVFMRSNGLPYAFDDFYAFDAFLELEETLYFDHELTPVSREWKNELLRDHQTQFTYCNMEFVTVKWDGDKIFTVTDNE